ncbi:MAG: adenylate/guanylate cyclase domain-containing protein [Alphaproteobacteria bacterium]|nr:adenylate/guanylate cyclase domain-containing protein [Alphaproteobacteria bacterium]
MAMTSLSPIADWIVAAGLAGEGEGALLDGFCRRAVAAGLPLARGGVIVDTLHPIHEGRAFRWRRDAGEPELIEYGPTEGDAAASWRASALYHLWETGGSLFHARLAAGEGHGFTNLAGWAAEGLTDYVALINRFAREGAIGEMDCVYSYWITDRPDGFTDADIEQLAKVMPSLALAVKCASLARIAETLAETYLGRDPARQVLAGRIGRGAAERINAVLWSSDLRGFTHIADTSPPRNIMALLNDYAEVVITAIHDHGGDVLKLIGDGILAIFPYADGPDSACGGAIAAEAALRQHVVRLNENRAAKDLPTTEIYLGLHIGEVFYGNIGSRERLDFTVIGPAVNEAARIAAMCRSAERNVLLSADFAAAVAAAGVATPVSVGRYALRGVARPQELFTLDRGPAG